MDHDLVSIGPSIVANAPHSVMKQALKDAPRLAYAFWRETLVDAAMYREGVARLGARDALSRIAHLLCELLLRLKAVGLSDNGSFRFAATQHHVASACGLSDVHVSRTMQDLMRRRLISREGRTIVVHGREELMAVADFDPSYLHQSPEPGW